MLFRSSFEIVPVQTPEFTSARLHWHGPVDLSANEILAPPKPSRSPSALEMAVAFLHGLLAEGQVPEKIARSRAAERGISEATLKRAKEAMGIVSTKAGFQDDTYWVWSLPGSENSPKGLNFTEGAHL